MIKVVLKLQNPDEFTCSSWGDRYKRIEISLVDYLNDGRPYYMITCIPDSCRNLHSVTSYSIEYLKKKVAEDIRGYKQKEKLKWLKV